MKLILFCVLYFIFRQKHVLAHYNEDGLVLLNILIFGTQCIKVRFNQVRSMKLNGSTVYDHSLFFFPAKEFIVSKDAS
jgi:hypothetical protein